MASYINITQAEMEAAVAAFKRPPDRASTNPNHEIAYDWHVSPRNNTGPKLSVRLYTSVLPGSNARACGKDAIRITVVASPYTQGEQFLFVLTRVHRTPGWDARMQERLTLAWCLLRGSPDCPACSGRMSPRAVRAVRGDKRSPIVRLFWGCTSRSCRGARSALKIEREGAKPRPPKTYEELFTTLTTHGPRKAAPVKGD